MYLSLLLLLLLLLSSRLLPSQACADEQVSADALELLDLLAPDLADPKVRAACLLGYVWGGEKGREGGCCLFGFLEGD